MNSLRVATAMLLVAGCQPAEYAVLIEAHATADVDSYTVTVIDLSGRSSAYERPAELDAEIDPTMQAFRIGIDLEGPREIMVHIVGRDELVPGGSAADPFFVATRCYVVNGVERDDVLLVPIAADLDGDTFSTDPIGTCRDRAPDGTRIDCDHACPAGEWVDCIDDAAVEPMAAMVNPAGSEICLDDIDQDCRGGDLEECPDNDDDGWNVCAAGQPPTACDCDDSLPLVHPTPGADEDEDDCNDSIDQNCDGMDLLCDLDGDGSRSNREVGGFPDCNDRDASINPDAPELCTMMGDTPVDENCNGFVDELEMCLGEDFDGDGFDVCRGGATTGCDCNDCDPGVRPGIAATDQCANAVDENCDGMVATCPASDGDGDGDANPADGGGDCDPVDPYRYSGAPEECGNGVDESCGAFPDNGCNATSDPDGDGWIEPPACEDNATLTPMRVESCNGADDDCDGRVDEMLSNPEGPPFDRHGRIGCAVGRLIDFASDLTHCGFCRNVCNTSGLQRADRCNGGVCDCTGEDDFDGPCEGLDTSFCCRDGCIDLNTDPRHCGRCDRSCEAEFPGRVSPPAGGLAQCSGQECVCGSDPPCAAGLTCCAGLGGACENTTNTVTHCGGCGNSCERPNVTPSCVGGQCDNRCNLPFDDCDRIDGPAVDVGEDRTGCETNLQTDAAHCGRCGAVCDLPNVAVHGCAGATCNIVACDPGYTDCDGTAANGCETHTAADINNCGACRRVCDLPRTTSHTCDRGTCEVATCDPNWGNCNGSDGDGCETDLLTNTDHCSGCGARCSLPNTATHSCSGGICQVVSCSSPFEDCDGLDGNGCEINLDTDELHCGTCPMSCGASMTCNSGVCGCDPGFLDCVGGGGCETPVTTANCNRCGNACGPMETCGAGGCRCGSNPAVSSGEACPGSTNQCCGGNCVDTTTSRLHCGGCGLSCPMGEACVGSGCQCPVSGRTCGPGETCCPVLGCVNTSTDERACGNCATACLVGETCNSGSCGCGSGARCALGQACCSGACANTTTNCGTCGNTCDSDEACNTSGMPRCCCGSTCAAVGPACPGNMPMERCGGSPLTCGG